MWVHCHNYVRCLKSYWSINIIQVTAYMDYSVLYDKSMLGSNISNYEPAQTIYFYVSKYIKYVHNNPNNLNQHN